MTGLAELKAGTTNETTVTTLDAEAVWPNQAAPVVPGSVASLSTPTVLQAGGFFVSVPGHPSKADGTVDLLVATSDEATEFSKRTISSYKKDNFYHHAEWLDMNNDGRLDVVAARCYEPQYVGKPDSELIWIEQPEDASADWETHVIYPNGPDVAFAVVDLDGDGNSQIIATEFFVNQRLALYKCAGASWSECDADSTEVVVIDDEEGTFFDLQWVDLNLDGVKDLLVTTQVGAAGARARRCFICVPFHRVRRPRHLTPLYLGPWLRILLQGTDGKGKVLAYEVPSEWATDTWTKHELADGYAPLHRFLPGQGSPGVARAFPVSNQSPHIIVTADDGGYVDMLVPTGAAFEYEKVTVIESTGTVGSPATGDVDGDGIAEVFGELLAGCQTLVPARPKPTAHHTMPLYRLPSPSSTPNPLLVARRPHPQPRHHQCLSTTSRGWLCTASEVCELAHARSLTANNAATPRPRFFHKTGEGRAVGCASSRFLFRNPQPRAIFSYRTSPRANLLF